MIHIDKLESLENPLIIIKKILSTNTVYNASSVADFLNNKDNIKIKKHIHSDKGSTIKFPSCQYQSIDKWKGVLYDSTEELEVNTILVNEIFKQDLETRTFLEKPIIFYRPDSDWSNILNYRITSKKENSLELSLKRSYQH